MGQGDRGSNVDYDGAWKEALDVYLEPFLRLCFPVVHGGIDWSRGVTPLDQELQEAVRDAEIGKQRVDKLVKVCRRDGTEEWLLVHLEIQSQPDRRLPERMYLYHRRIADRYNRRVVSLAVLADNRPRFRPGPYEQETWGCLLRFEYPTCKLLDFGSEQLERETNPAAIVIAAHRGAQSQAENPVGRKSVKWQLTRRLHERGYGKRDILELYRLIDWLIALPEELEIEFRRELVEYEHQKHMPYITSIERLGRKEGRKEGREEGIVVARQKAVCDALEVRFVHIPSGIRHTVEAIRDEARLRSLYMAAIQIESIEDFSRRLKRETAES